MKKISVRIGQIPSEVVLTPYIGEDHSRFEIAEVVLNDLKFVECKQDGTTPVPSDALAVIHGYRIGFQYKHADLEMICPTEKVAVRVAKHLLFEVKGCFIESGLPSSMLRCDLNVARQEYHKWMVCPKIDGGPEVARGNREIDRNRAVALDTLTLVEAGSGYFHAKNWAQKAQAEKEKVERRDARIKWIGSMMEGGLTKEEANFLYGAGPWVKEVNWAEFKARIDETTIQKLYGILEASSKKQQLRNDSETLFGESSFTRAKAWAEYAIMAFFPNVEKPEPLPQKREFKRPAFGLSLASVWPG